jgi:hypothetical protein
MSLVNKEHTMGIFEDMKENAAKEADKTIAKQKVKLRQQKAEQQGDPSA